MPCLSYLQSNFVSLSDSFCEFVQNHLSYYLNVNLNFPSSHILPISWDYKRIPTASKFIT